MFSKKDIERAKKRNFLKTASEELGKPIKDVKSVIMYKETKDKRSLGKRLYDLNKRKR